MRGLLPLFVASLIVPAPAQGAENIPLPPFRSVELRGGGDILIVPSAVQRVTIIRGTSRVTRFRMRERGRLQIDACDTHCPPNYSLQIRIESPQLPDVAIAGGGLIRAAPGFAPQGELSAAIDGGGKIDAGAVDASEVSAAVNGGGQISVRARSSLSAAVNGGGEIRYSGNPQVSSAIHGGGAVHRGD
jgi:hypothetical protein